MKKQSLIVLLLFTSCSTFRPNQSSVVRAKPLDVVEKKVEPKDDEESLNFNQDTHPSIEKWKNHFLTKGKERFIRFVKNGQYFREVIQTTLEESGIPHELYYLAHVESGFQTSARSHASAVGIWQFIRGTAKRYDLTVNRFVDERRDPIRSTEAASKYLRDLYNVFNSWPLAMAAYNCGERRVLSAIMRGNTRSFWELRDKKLLPRETREYVPKILAAISLGENIETHFGQLHNPEAYPDVEAIEVPSRVPLKHIAKSSKISLDELKKINPGLKKSYSPAHLSNYDIWIPKDKASNIKSSMATMANYRIKIKKYSSPMGLRYHVVKRGENLGLIARRYKTNPYKLKRLNNLKSSRIFPGQKIYFKTKVYKSSKGDKYYFVKKGDTLGSISHQYKLSLSYLKRVNGLTSGVIRKGQKLKIGHGIVITRHKVRKGDNLTLIANLYGKSVRSLKRKNRLKSERIYIGQNLKL